MGYFLLILTTLSWSFVGLLVKAASASVDSTTITFARFGIGVVFLGLFLLIKDRGIKFRFNMTWIWIGAAGKCLNYFLENVALTIGYSYGNIVILPIQTVLSLLVAVFFLKERVSPKSWVSAALCLSGVLLIGWNGMSWQQLSAGGGLTTVLYALAAVGVVFHLLSQKMLIRELDAGNMNFSVFAICSLMMALPLPSQLEWSGDIGLGAIGALIALGLITGLSFYWFSESLRTVPFSVAVIFGNSSAFFSIIWSYFLLHEPITVYVIAGVAVGAIGLLVLNLPSRQARVKVHMNQVQKQSG